MDKVFLYVQLDDRNADPTLELCSPMRLTVRGVGRGAGVSAVVFGGRRIEGLQCMLLVMSFPAQNMTKEAMMTLSLFS